MQPWIFYRSLGTVAALCCLTVGACSRTPTKQDELSRFSSASVSLEVKNVPAARCLSPRPKVGRPVPGPSGTLWQTAFPDSWCEYRKGRLVRAWTHAPRQVAQKLLIFKENRAFLTAILPSFVSAQEYREGECANPQLV